MTQKKWIDIRQIIFPIGYVYISMNSTSPSTLFGGQWTELTGVFPYFNHGTGTGGKNEHTLSIKEMPRHYHNLKHRNDEGSSQGWGFTTTYGTCAWEDGNCAWAGESLPFSIMPKYQEMYAWQRVG